MKDDHLERYDLDKEAKRLGYVHARADVIDCLLMAVFLLVLLFWGYILFG